MKGTVELSLRTLVIIILILFSLALVVIFMTNTSALGEEGMNTAVEKLKDVLGGF